MDNLVLDTYDLSIAKDFLAFNKNFNEFLTSSYSSFLRYHKLILKKQKNALDVENVLAKYEKTPRKKDEINYVHNVPEEVYEHTFNNKEVFEVVSKLPWNKSAKITLDLKKVRRVLNESHYALKQVKELILQYVASLKFTTTKATPPILCLVGNAGIGKTSILLSLAKALNTHLFTIGASLASHSSALMGVANKNPGAIIKELIKAKVNNPVILFDEIDKLNLDHNESSYADLLNLFDPSLNKAYKDNFIQVPFDLSKALFVCTANDVNKIPDILKDRLYLVYLDNYSFAEKHHIAKYFLIKHLYKQYKGLNKKLLNFSDEAISELITNYTFESGVRQLNRLLNRIIQEYLTKVGTKGHFFKLLINKKNLRKWLNNEIPLRTYENENFKHYGVANSIISNHRGSILAKVEASMLLYGNELKIFSKYENIRNEGIHLLNMIVSYIKANNEHFNLDCDWFRCSFYVYLDDKIKTHKDLYDSSTSIFVALISSINKQKIDHRLGFSGNVSLKGELLGVDYFKERFTAGFNSGCKLMLFPKPNKDELFKIGTTMDAKIHFSYDLRDVYKYAFEKEIIEVDENNENNAIEENPKNEQKNEVQSKFRDLLPTITYDDLKSKKHKKIDEIPTIIK